MSKSKFNPGYTKEFKEEMVKRMLPPENISPKDLAKECGVTRTSLVNWLKVAKDKEEKKIEKDEKDKLEWIPVDMKQLPEENIIKKTITLKIGEIKIEIEEGFNKDLLLDVMKVVTSI